MSRSKPRLCGWEKKSRDALCRSWGPKNLRRRSEIRAGSLALTAQVRSERDHSERENVDHRKDPSTLKKDRACSSCPCPVSVPTAVPRVKKGGPSCGKRGQGGQVYSTGPLQEASPSCILRTKSPGACPTPQPPGPGVRVQSVPHLGQQAGKGAVRPA